MIDAWGAERDALLDHLAEAQARNIFAGEWATILAGVSPMGGCHRAALDTGERANRTWVRAREALEDHEYERDRPAIEAHRRTVENLIEDATLARMDNLLGPGWLEEK